MLAFLRRFANAYEWGACWSCGCHRATDVGLCQRCNAALPRWYPRCCQHLSTLEPPDTNSRNTCRHWFAALRWEPQVQALIRLYKFQRKAELAPLLANQLAAHIRQCYGHYTLPDCIVAVPTTQQAWRQRGFHQTAMLAHQLSQRLNVPYVAGALRKIKAVPQQHTVSQTERWQNSRRSQLALQDFTGCSVAVVDDVLSTGATVMAAADALYRKGATTVDAWAVCYNQHD